MDKPDSCPFCGGEPETLIMNGGWMVACLNNRCLVRPHTDTLGSKEAALIIWNRRTRNEAGSK